MRASGKNHINVAVLGGGVWVVKLVRELARSAVLPSMTLRLAARDQQRLGIIARHCDLVIKSIREDCAVVAAASLDVALAGSDAVVCMIRVGGAAARLRDETFPARFRASGDEGLGCGGMANACRSVPVVEQLCRAIRAHSPQAKVFNLMAPLGVTTRVFIDEGLDAVGVCELPAVTQGKLLAALPQPWPALEYGGLNHLGWFWTRPDVERAPLAKAAIDAKVADERTIRRFEAVPLWYYYKLFDPVMGASLGLMQTTYGRATQLARLADSIVLDLRAKPGSSPRRLQERSTPWFREALVPLLEAVFSAEPYEGFLNVRNEGLIPQLSHDAIVEVRASIHGARTRLIPCRSMPAEVLRFLKGIACAEEETYRGARIQDGAEKLRRLHSAVDHLRECGLRISAPSGQVAAEILGSSVYP
jgi:6-phospho-beta-glucosidase